MWGKWIRKSNWTLWLDGCKSCCICGRSSWLYGLALVSEVLWKMVGVHFKLGHNQFLLYIFLFIIHLSLYSSMPYNLTPWKHKWTSYKHKPRHKFMYNKGLEDEIWGDHNWGSHWLVVCQYFNWCSWRYKFVVRCLAGCGIWVFTALLFKIKSLVTLFHWAVVPNGLKDCNAIKILGTTCTATCARRLESSYLAFFL
jgi:hypothetical protein